MLYVMRGGLKLDDVEWVELSESNNEFKAMQMDVLKSDKVDAIFVTGNTDKFEQAGIARAGIGSAADDQRPDPDFNLDHAGEKTRIGGAPGQGATDGHSFRAHASRRDRSKSSMGCAGANRNVKAFNTEAYRSCCQNLIPIMKRWRTLTDFAV